MLVYRASLPLSRQPLNFADGIIRSHPISTGSLWRETVALLAARAPRLRKAVRDAARAGHAYVVVDGTLIPIDRVPQTVPSTPASTRSTA